MASNANICCEVLASGSRKGTNCGRPCVEGRNTCRYHISNALIHIAHPERLDWDMLSLNSNPHAIRLLMANPDKINWEKLSMNEGAMEILMANPEKIIWKTLSANPNPIAERVFQTIFSGFALESP